MSCTKNHHTSRSFFAVQNPQIAWHTLPERQARSGQESSGGEGFASATGTGTPPDSCDRCGSGRRGLGERLCLRLFLDLCFLDLLPCRDELSLRCGRCSRLGDGGGGGGGWMAGPRPSLRAPCLLAPDDDVPRSELGWLHSWSTCHRWIRCDIGSKFSLYSKIARRQVAPWCIFHLLARLGSVWSRFDSYVAFKKDIFFNSDIERGPRRRAR